MTTTTNDDLTTGDVVAVDDDEEDGIYFDYETKTWRKRDGTESDGGSENHEVSSAGSSDDDAMDGDTSNELYFGDDDMKWEEGLKSKKATTRSFKEPQRNFNDGEAGRRTVLF